MEDDDDDNVSMLSELVQDEVFILGELIGGYQLSPEEHVQGLKDKHMRPYCVVKFKNKIIHYSSPCREAGRDPIWTVSTGSLFLVKANPSTLPRDNLQVTLRTKNNPTSLRGAVLVDVENYYLGRAQIDGQTLLSNCNEQRLELPLKDLHGNDVHDESTVALRFRLATETDIKLIDLLRQQGISPPKTVADSSFHGSHSLIADNPVKDLILGEGNQLPIADCVTEHNEAKLAGDYLLGTISSAFKPSTKFDSETCLRKVRVKPGPDLTRVDETKYLSPLDLSKETRGPSKRWVEAGSGQIGTLHLEILSCHDLPNVDVGETMGNLTDAFVVAVFEDVMLQTPVIDDELSPHWLPWTQRAFRVGIVHPSSVLYLGVFDYDFASEHEAIGRVAINLTNFRSNTLYTLTYKLHPTSDLSERTPNGSITVRLRIEYPDEKAAVMAALQPKPVFHVNTRNAKTFKVLRYACFGEFDIEEKFTWAVTRSYIFEILEYWRALKFYTKQSFWSLVFWRGQVNIFKMNLPVHSAVLFISGAALVERPWLIVPFHCMFVAWFLLAAMAHRRETPSPWHTCTSFLYYAEVLLTGKSTDYLEKIRPAEYLKQTEEYEKTLEEWKKRYQETLDRQYAMEEKLLTVGNENITTEVSGQMMPLDLLEKLGRYQGIMGRLCTKFRRIKSIIIWEDSLTSFWITAKCLLIGLVSLSLPWRFLLYFVGRIVVYGFLGPQMKLVDMYLQARRAEQKESQLEEFKKQTRLARIRREEAVKLKDMKCLAFGEYVTLVPCENLPHHYDHPLHESRARYVSAGSTQKNKAATSRIPGQQLYGLMIPHTKKGSEDYERETRDREEKLASLGEQVKRLQSIQKHLSCRPVSAGLDKELPDDLGYEVTLCDELSTFQGDNTTKAPESPTALSLSPTGFKAGNNRAEKHLLNCSNSPRSKFLANTASKLMKEHLIEEEEDDHSNALSNVQSQDEQSCDDSRAPSLLSQEGIEVDQDADYMTPLLAYPNLGEARNASDVKDQPPPENDTDIDHAERDCYSTQLTHEPESTQEQTSHSSQHCHDNCQDDVLSSASQQIKQTHPSDNNGCDDDGTDIFMTPGLVDEMTLLQSASFATARLDSHEEEKKESEPIEDLSFMTPRCEEEDRKQQEQEASALEFLTPGCKEEDKKQQEQQASVLEFLQLELHDHDSGSVEDEVPVTSNQRQLMGPRQKAAVSARSIGSGSLDFMAEQSLKPKQGEESIQARSIGTGSVRSGSPGSDARLVIEECMADAHLNLDSILDESEQSESKSNKGQLKLMTSLKVDVQSEEAEHCNGGEEQKQKLVTSTPKSKARDESELLTPLTRPGTKPRPASESDEQEVSRMLDNAETRSSEKYSLADTSWLPELEQESKLANRPATKNPGTVDNSETRTSDQGNSAVPSWFEDMGTNSIVAAPTDVTSNTTLLASDASFVTAMTSNIFSAKAVPPASQSLRLDDTKETTVAMRRTWSSGSMQREKSWIKENPTDTIVEMNSRRDSRLSLVKEEGLEVVAMGRLLELDERFDDDLNTIGSGCTTETVRSDDTESRQHGLSVPYKACGFVEVAHFRP